MSDLGTKMNNWRYRDEMNVLEEGDLIEWYGYGVCYLEWKKNRKEKGIIMLEKKIETAVLYAILHIILDYEK